MRSPYRAGEGHAPSVTSGLRVRWRVVLAGPSDTGARDFICRWMQLPTRGCAARRRPAGPLSWLVSLHACCTAQVPAGAMPLVLYSDSEDDEEGQQDVDDWWGDAGGEEEEEERGATSSESDSDWESGSSDGSSSSSSSSSESDSDSERELGREAAGGKGSASQLRQQSAALAAAAGSPAGPDGLDEATRRLLLQSVLDGEAG